MIVFQLISRTHICCVTSFVNQHHVKKLVKFLTNVLFYKGFIKYNNKNGITSMKTHIDVAHVHLVAKKFETNCYYCNKTTWYKSQSKAREEKGCTVLVHNHNIFWLNKSLQGWRWNTTMGFGRFGPLHLQRI
jgi:hypothetical protein